MIKVTLYAALLAILGVTAFGQSSDRLTFEVATVRPAVPHADGTPLIWQGCKGGPETSDPARMTCTGPLGMLICVAYGVQFYQLAGPDWLLTDFYDLTGKVPVGITKAEYQVMWQNLLSERFHLVLHHEARERTVHSLVVSKGGSKIQTSAESESKPAYSQTMNGWVMQFTGKNEPLSVLAGFLSTRLATNGPVSNDTGLTGGYDFALEFTPDDYLVQAGDKAGPTLATALETQLGLKLETKKSPIDVLVVDRAEKKASDN